MTASDILKELNALGSESIKKVLRNHGAREPFFGVRIGDMQKMWKQIKKDYRLALELFDTGNYDAMYFAGLIADDAQMTKKDLRHWAAEAYCGPLASTVVAPTAAGSAHGQELSLEWIDTKEPLVAAAGWATLSSLVSIKDDAELNIPELKKLLQRVERTLHEQPDVVRYQMNWFVIALGSFVKPLMTIALQAGEKIGKVTVDLGNNSCEAFYAPDYIHKVAKRGAIGKKRKSAKC